MRGITAFATVGILVPLGLAVPTTAAARPVATAATSAAVCGAPNLSEKPRGTKVDTTLSLGSATARLQGIVTKPTGEGAFPGSAFLKNGRVTVASKGGPSRTDSLSKTKSAVELINLTVQGSTVRTPYLCLVRSRKNAEPYVVLGIGSSCMTECPDFVFVPNSGPVLTASTYIPELVVTRAAVYLRSHDIAFVGPFSDHAGSWVPIQDFEVTDGVLRNVTTEHPVAIRKDAHTAWHLIATTSPDENRLGDLAGWTADECSLGNQTQAFAKLQKLNADGQLESHDSTVPSGSAYIKQLRSLLAHEGYID